MLVEKNKKIFKERMNFECQGSSNCFVSRKSYGYVYLSNKDVLRLSKYTKIKSKDFLNFIVKKMMDLYI